MSNYHIIGQAKYSDFARVALFKTLWANLPKKSFLSGLWLRAYENTPLMPNCFCHILQPDKYPGFQMYFGNIILLTPGERGLYLQGKEEERIQYSLDLEESSQGKTTADWSRIKALEASLKVDYAKLFPSTRWGLIAYQYSLQDILAIVGPLNKKYLENLHSIKN
jgi:hypothetical protein